MQTTELTIARDKARDLWRKYREHLAYQTPTDQHIEKIYKRLAQGRTVIQAIASIRAAGLGEDHRPKLAIARADAKHCWCRVYRHANLCVFISDSPRDQQRLPASRIIRVTDEIFAHANEGRAQVPLIPVHLRPRRGLANYHILWEADWESVPVDPMLLRRIADDAWLVVAAWELTSVEQAAIKGLSA